MKIIVAGAGEVGSHLAKMLSEEYHDITVIDDSEKRLDSLASSADLITIEGDITQFAILKKADTQRSDLFLAVSPDENSNILSAMIAKQLGSKKVVARIDNSDYLLPGNKEIFVNMGIDYMFYPEKVAAEEVITLLGHTSTTEYVDFSGGKLVLVAFKVEAGSPLANRTLLEVTRSREKLNY
ncbi:MAG: NAD-binding protein, partial [Mucinivorans sp.]